MLQQRETSFRTSGVFQREEAFLRAQREAERKRQERELLHIQEEQERLQRKKVPEIYRPHLHGSLWQLGHTLYKEHLRLETLRVFIWVPRESRRS